MFFRNSDINQILSDLSQSHLMAIKSEFEAEGVRRAELKHLSYLCLSQGINTAIKIGGCEAHTDFYDAAQPYVSYVVAPMIETPYAAAKFCQLIESAMPESEIKPQFLINIETKTALDNLSSILDVCVDHGVISGIVFGRVDFTFSLGLNRSQLPSRQVSEGCLEAATKTKPTGLDFVVGGGISAESLDFLDEVKSIHLTRFETRKCIFSSELISSPSFTQALAKAVLFELLWLKAKKQYYTDISFEDDLRIDMLSRRHLFKLN